MPDRRDDRGGCVTEDGRAHAEDVVHVVVAVDVGEVRACPAFEEERHGISAGPEVAADPAGQRATRAEERVRGGRVSVDTWRGRRGLGRGGHVRGALTGELSRHRLLKTWQRRSPRPRVKQEQWNEVFRIMVLGFGNRNTDARPSRRTHDGATGACPGDRRATPSIERRTNVPSDHDVRPGCPQGAVP